MILGGNRFDRSELAGAELATGVNGEALARADRTVMVVTAGISLWNMGAAYLAGLLLYHASQRGVVRL